MTTYDCCSTDPTGASSVGGCFCSTKTISMEESSGAVGVTLLLVIRVDVSELIVIEGTAAGATGAKVISCCGCNCCKEYGAV